MIAAKSPHKPGNNPTLIHTELVVQPICHTCCHHNPAHLDCQAKQSRKHIKIHDFGRFTHETSTLPGPGPCFAAPNHWPHGPRAQPRTLRTKNLYMGHVRANSEAWVPPDPCVLKICANEPPGLASILLSCCGAGLPVGFCLGLALASACFFRHSASTWLFFQQNQHSLSLFGFGLFAFEPWGFCLFAS